MRKKSHFVYPLLRLAFALMLIFAASATAQDSVGNRPERLEWFRDLGFGLFIHWSLDSQLGSVISHSLVGASEDYVRRYLEVLPKTFNPKKFNPEDWAVLAKLAGMKYVVFTAKHHSGFCMFQTKTTDFSIMNTPYSKDITARVNQAFREQGLALGLYYSPDDFYFLHRQGKVISRRRLGVTPPENPPLMQYDQAQLRELLTNYGRIDIMFLDGPPEGLRELCWELQPDIVVTRGAIETPEQHVPGVPLEGAWEANLTMGTQWQYKPTHETYKSGTELIEYLIETRAKGGNLLLNVGPHPDGTLPIEQEARLREIALWMFVNGEAIYEVRPWVITNEGSTWFTKRKSEDTVYLFLTQTHWRLGETKTFTVRSVRAKEGTKISLLGQTGGVLEYFPDVVPRPRWQQDEDGLQLTVTMAQRLYNNRRWPNPVVVRLTDVEPGLLPPKVATGEASWEAESQTLTLRAELQDLGQADSVQLGFQYRRKRGMYEQAEDWQRTKLVKHLAPSLYEVQVKRLEGGQDYEYRAIVEHPLVTMYGQEKTFTVP